MTLPPLFWPRRSGPLARLLAGCLCAAVQACAKPAPPLRTSAEHAKPLAPTAPLTEPPSETPRTVLQRKPGKDARPKNAPGSTPSIDPAPPEALTQSFGAEFEAEVTRLVSAALEAGEAAGAVVSVGTRQWSLFERAYGYRMVEPAREPMTTETLFDLASVTKVVATTASVMLLVQEGRLKLDDPVAHYLPAFDQPDKAGISVAQLLTHTSGLTAANPPYQYRDGPQTLLEHIARSRLVFRPGTRYLYSDVGFIVLGLLVEAVAGEPLERFATQRLFEPLGMLHTAFNPTRIGLSPIAATAPNGAGFFQGQVHDPRARLLDGVAGHAGLFSTAGDLSRFAQATLGREVPEGHPVFSRTTLELMRRPQPVPGQRHALGWDLPEHSTPKSFSASSFGHGGFTGTSLWMDPERGLFVVFLSNRLHPDGQGNVIPTAKRVRDLAALSYDRYASP